MSVEVRAQNTISMTSVKAIKDATDQSAQLLAEMEDYAEQAGTTLTGIYADAESAKTSAENASEYASRALGTLSTVQSIAETVDWITRHGTMTLTTDTALDPTHVYFVRDPNGDYEVGSYRYSIVSEPETSGLSTYYELSIDESLNNYVGTHLALTTEGLWLLPASSGTNKVLIATGAGSTYTTAGTYIIDSNNNVVASFRGDGVTIGENANGKTRSEITANGMQITRKNGSTDVQIANLGYGLGNAETGTATTPYYTLGTRRSGVDVGNYSTVAGYNGQASGHTDFAEGYNTIASGGYGSHAEGDETIASGEASHAEGSVSVASGDFSHAEGDDTTASGKGSHAGGHGTNASSQYQTAIGKYNEVDTVDKYAVIVGNGTANSTRSNAFMVDWDGYIYPQATKMTDFVVEQGTDGIWSYRKWKNGDYHAWYEGNINVGAGTAMGGGYYHTSSSALTPPTFSQTVTSLTGASNGAQLFSYVGHSATYQTYWWNGASGAVSNIPVRIDMYGTWQ